MIIGPICDCFRCNSPVSDVTYAFLFYGNVCPTRALLLNVTSLVFPRRSQECVRALALSLKLPTVFSWLPSQGHTILARPVLSIDSLTRALGTITREGSLSSSFSSCLGGSKEGKDSFSPSSEAGGGESQAT